MKYNHDLSMLIAGKYSHEFDIKDCYGNVYRIMEASWPELPADAKREVLYCYVPTVKTRRLCYFRHAFVLLDGQIVEPLRHMKMEHVALAEIIPIKCLKREEYKSLLLEHRYFSLFYALLEDELEAFNNYELGTALNLIDLSELVAAFAGDDARLAAAVLNSIGSGEKIIEVPEEY